MNAESAAVLYWLGADPCPCGVCARPKERDELLSPQVMNAGPVCGTCMEYAWEHGGEAMFLDRLDRIRKGEAV